MTNKKGIFSQIMSCCQQKRTWGHYPTMLSPPVKRSLKNVLPTKYLKNCKKVNLKISIKQVMEKKKKPQTTKQNKNKLVKQTQDPELKNCATEQQQILLIEQNTSELYNRQTVNKNVGRPFLPSNQYLLLKDQRKILLPSSPKIIFQKTQTIYRPNNNLTNQNQTMFLGDLSKLSRHNHTIFQPRICSPLTPTEYKSTSDSNPLQLTVKRSASTEKIQRRKFQIQATESKMIQSKKLVDIAQQSHVVDNSRTSNYFIKVNSILSPKERETIKKSQLQKVKASCISKQAQQSERLSNQRLSNERLSNQKQRKQINPDCLNPQNFHSPPRQSAQRRYQQQYGYSIMSINSCVEEVKFSKINHNLQESVVMHDFFNPAKKLFVNWNGRGEVKNEQQKASHQ